ncbi:MAG: RagB/SusD family nutrient uptake outer membrane protein, partial [Alistipes sp.]|nr:RagB/SusD family nutrient uptake outer membrane protein [Alistipes sp.]
PVYRYAEVLLNYAEAKAELGTLTQADLDISVNEIRDRVGMPDLDMTKANANPDRYLSSEEYGFTNVNGTNKGVILEIRRERAIELMQEGFRFDDLVRWKAGYCIDQPITGMYFKGPGEYDLSGDGKTDLILYAEGTAKPDAGTGVMVYQIGEEITLSDGNRGYLSYHKNVERTKFNEERDYLYPIPTDERSLNKNLTQNPGWADGLDF